MIESPLQASNSYELFSRWREHGDRQAREELIHRFMPLARKLARRYAGANEPLEDLLQVASLGLVKAVDRFDPARGTSFASFGVPTMLGELKRYFRDAGWSAHVPREAQELALRVQQANRDLSAQTGRSPSVQRLAEYLEVEAEEVVSAIEAAAAHHSTSLDAPVGNDDEEGRTLLETLSQEDTRFEAVDATVAIAQAAKVLSERERQVLALYYLEGHTQVNIAERIGVSQMQVSRILRRTVERLSLVAGRGADQTAGR